MDIQEFNNLCKCLIYYRDINNDKPTEEYPAYKEEIDEIIEKLTILINNIDDNEYKIRLKYLYSDDYITPNEMDLNNETDKDVSELIKNELYMITSTSFINNKRCDIINPIIEFEIS